MLASIAARAFEPLAGRRPAPGLVVRGGPDSLQDIAVSVEGTACAFELCAPGWADM
jgi:hypothetical protein